MDRVKASRLSDEINGLEIAGYTDFTYLNHGKSAAVFRAYKDSLPYAFKIFDNELIENYGAEIQISRIEEEIKLKGHDINHLVRIEDGGTHSIGNDTFYFIVMEYIDGNNLKEFILKEKYDLEFIQMVLNSLSDVCETLLKRGIVHRDIKPENIMIDNDRNLILMDLGVIKHIGQPSKSDQDEKQFLGTLRYAPPEFILRQEKDDDDGWRAVNLYQIGGVLHDLTQKKELFSEKAPYGVLLMSIVQELPVLQNNGFPVYIIQLIQNLLTKEPVKRIELCSETEISKIQAQLLNKDESIESSIDKLKSMSLHHVREKELIESLQKSTTEKLLLTKEISESVYEAAMESFRLLIEHDVIKGLNISDQLRYTNFEKKTLSNTEKQILKLITLKGSIDQGFSSNIYIIIRLINDENRVVSLELTTFLPQSISNHPNHLKPDFILNKLISEITKRNQKRNIISSTINLDEIYKGVVTNDTIESFKTQLTKYLIEKLRKAKELMSDEVSKILENEKKRAENKPATIIIPSRPSTTFL